MSAVTVKVSRTVMVYFELAIESWALIYNPGMYCRSTGLSFTAEDK